MQGVACSNRYLLITDFLGRKLNTVFFFFLKWRHQNHFIFMDGLMQIDILEKKFSVPPWDFKVLPS